MKGALLTFSTLLAISIALPMETEVQPDAKNGKLNVLTITQEEIEGEYHSSTGGIHFRSIVRGEYHFLSITTAGGEPLVIAKQPHDSTTLMTLSGTDFLVMKQPSGSGLTKYTDYIVPSVFQKSVKKALKHEYFSTELLQQLDTEVVNETRQNAIESLALRPEIELCMSAAQALGDLGIIGSQNPAAMPFYALTLRMTKFRDILLSGEGDLTMDGEDDDHRGVQLEDRQKRSCDSRCRTGSCPYRGYGPNCYGMCGRRCSCQSWFCGDCCVHQGCLGHDYCCGTYGYSSWSCITVWNIVCDRPYSC